MSLFNKQMTRSILVAGGAVLAAMLLLFFGVRAMSCRLNWLTSTAGFVEPYVVLVQHGRTRGGSAVNHCLKVIDVRDGTLLLQKHIPSGLKDAQVAVIDDVLVAGLSQQNRVIQFNAAKREFALVDMDALRAIVPGAAGVAVDPERGVLRVTDLEGVGTDLHPLTLKSGAANNIRPMESLETFGPVVDGPLHLTAGPRSALIGPAGEVLKEDVGLVHPTIIRQVGTGDDATAIILSYETVERKRWVLSAITKQGAFAWQIRQNDVAKDAGLPFEYARPQYHFVRDGMLVLIFEGRTVGFPGRILRVDVATGTWEVFSPY